MENTFSSREDIILALQTEFNEKPAGFSYNKTALRFWTYNRLLHYYWDIKSGRKETFRTTLNPATGYYELSVEYKRQNNIQ